MTDKKVVSKKTATATKTVHQPDGTIVDTITTTVTETFSDGSTRTTTTVETIQRQDDTGSRKSSPEAQDAAESKAPKVDNSTDPKWMSDALDEHNILRAKHGSPPLILNAELGKIAQAWANTIAKKGKMEHSTNGFGENIYWSTEKVDGKRPCEAWYSEIKDYNWNKIDSQRGTGHFTQLIWKASKEMGIAMAHGSSGYYVVANYNPPGNFIGRYPENIQPPK